MSTEQHKMFELHVSTDGEDTQSQLHVNGGHKKLFSMALRSCCCRFNNLATLDAASFTSSDEEQQQQQVNRPSPTKLHTNGTV